MGVHNRFVADGYSRAYAAIEPGVRAEVQAEYADRLQNASFFGRIWIRWEMNREIRRRVDQSAPPDALY